MQGFGAQFGLFYDSGYGLKLGASYKTAQKFSAFDFDNAYLDNLTSKNELSCYFISWLWIFYRQYRFYT
ncbi:MAG: hypothetical protein ACI9OE_001703 [Mariniflexile sp.]|jgi:hypothetical protein